MLPGPKGLEAAPGFGQRLLQALPENWLDKQQLQLDFIELAPPIDSSAMQPQHWFQFAALIQHQAKQADGLVLLQGTDTLAWTGAALFWLLPDLTVPVILTAAQKPLNTPDSDALSNVQEALIWASQPGAQGVYISFCQQLFDPRSCRKRDSQKDQAFCNPQGGALAEFKPSPSPLPHLKRPQQLSYSLSQEQLDSLARNFEVKLLRLALIPGLDGKLVTNLSQGLDGLLLEGLGAGTSPPLPEFYQALEDQQLITGMLSQCWSGGVSQVYAASAEAHQAGVLFLGQTTPENAQAALTWLLALEHLQLITRAQLRPAWQSACSSHL